MALPQAGDLIAGKYRIERTLGRGGMGVVFGVIHELTGKRFAVKWLHGDAMPSSSQASKRFAREARLASRFAHPNVVQVYDFGEVDGSFYMVMEWLDGESLAERLERTGPLDFPTARALLLPCMWAMDKAHAAGIVHRDLKPANIFLCCATEHRPERVKVIDFGISKWLGEPGEINSLATQSGTLLGTPYYISPEQLRGHGVDSRTDIYAFGVILYEMLSGQRPFPADNFGELVLQIATATPVPLCELVPDLWPQVDAIVARAMARSADERFQNLSQLIAALTGVPAPAGAHDLALPTRPPSQPTLQRMDSTPAAATPVAAAPVAVNTPGLVSLPPPSAASRRRSVSYAFGALLLVVGALVWLRAQPRAITDSIPAAASHAAGPVEAPPIVTSALSAATHPESVAAPAAPRSSRLDGLPSQPAAVSAVPAGLVQDAGLQAAAIRASDAAQVHQAPPRAARPSKDGAGPAQGAAARKPLASSRAIGKDVPKGNSAAGQESIAPSAAPHKLEHNPLHMDLQ
jgi:serine/threonine protein kinase